MRKILKVTANVLAVLCIFYTLCGVYILSHYYPESHDSNGDLTLLVKVSVVIVPLSFMGAFWLSMQYIDTKIVSDNRLKVRFLFICAVCFIVGRLLSHLVPYLAGLFNPLWG